MGISSQRLEAVEETLRLLLLPWMLSSFSFMFSLSVPFLRDPRDDKLVAIEMKKHLLLQCARS
jgi:hypothetical protein